MEVVGTPDRAQLRAEQHLSRTVATPPSHQCRNALSLDGYGLTTLPNLLFLSSSGFASSLTSLNVSANKLEQIIPSISTLRHLEILHAQSNRLTTLTSDMVHLNRLRILDVSRNRLTEMPAFLGCMPMLESINLSGNRIEMFEEEVLRAPRLRQLYLTRNPIKNVSPDVYLASVQQMRHHFQITVESSDALLNALDTRDQPHQESPSTDQNLHLAETPKRSNAACDGQSLSNSFLSQSLHLDLIPFNAVPDCPSPESCISPSSFCDDSDMGWFSDHASSAATSCQSMKFTEDHSVILEQQNVRLTIPPRNASGLHSQVFNLAIITNISQYDPTFMDTESILASPLIHAGPHGAEFFPDSPAVLDLPVTVPIRSTDIISCLVSSTALDTPAVWEILPSEQWNFDSEGSSLHLQISHFSLFCAVVRPGFPTASLHVPTDSEENCHLEVSELPGVSLDIPAGAVPTDLHVHIKVLFAEQEYTEDTQLALATPIVMLEPHRQEFVQPVEVTLPLPDCSAALEIFRCSDPTRALTIWHSDTKEGEPLSWQPLRPDECTGMRIWEDTTSGVQQVTFSVRRFCFFRGLWSWLAESMHAARIGASYVYPRIGFPMMCQALMRYQPDNRAFSLEVVVYRAERPFPEVGNYSRVGGSIKSRIVRPGDIRIRLVSEDFTSDRRCGEAARLAKVEEDFRGREFEKQFACVFREDKVLPSGIFGKVFIERVSGGKCAETIFEFNLIKSDGRELRVVECGEWSVEEMRRFGASFGVLRGSGWRRLVHHLGFTRAEVRRLGKAQDPFYASMAAYQGRGGTGADFCGAVRRSGRRVANGRRRLLPALPSDADTLSSVTRPSEADSIEWDQERSTDTMAHEDMNVQDSTLTEFDEVFSRGFKRPLSPLSSELEESDTDEPTKVGPAIPFTPIKRALMKQLESTARDCSPAKKRKIYVEDVVEKKQKPFRRLKRYNAIARLRRISSSVAHSEAVDVDVVDGPLKGPCDVDLSRLLTDLELWQLSEPLASRWREVAHLLELPEEKVYDISVKHPTDHKECAFQVLVAIKSREPEKASLGSVSSMLVEMGLTKTALSLT